MAYSLYPEVLQISRRRISHGDPRFHPTVASDDAVGLGLARWGIAETGSLVFHSGPDAPTLLNFLPLHHVIALDVRTILAYLEDYAEVEAKMQAPPRTSTSSQAQAELPT